MSERLFGFALGWFSCSGIYLVAHLYQEFKKFTDKYEVLIYDKEELDGKIVFSSQEYGYDGEFYRCEHGKAFGIRCSECDKKS